MVRCSDNSDRGYSRRRYAGGLLVTGVSPGIINAIEAGEINAGHHETPTKLTPPTFLEYVCYHDVTADGAEWIRGWTTDGLWSLFYDQKTGKPIKFFFFDYSNTDLLVRGTRGTLSQLRSKGVSWEEINGVHNSRKTLYPKCKELSERELAAVA